MKRTTFTRRSKLIAIALSTVALLTVVGVVLAAAVTVDTFNGGSLSLQVISSGPTTTSGVDPDGSAIGNDREAVLQWTLGPGRINLYANDLGTGNLSYNAQNGVRGLATIRWDGSGNAATTNDQGLSNLDLTDGGLNDGFHFEVINDDLPAIVIFRIYSSASDWSQYTLNLPGGIDTAMGDHVDFFVPFALFSIGGTGGADYTSVTSIEIVIDGTVTAGADISIDFFDSDDYREYGDLPNTYGAAVVNAYQVPHGLRLGRNVDIEVVSQPDVNAGTTTSGDDRTDIVGEVDDEDGVVRTTGVNWTPGGTGSLDVTVSGCATTCRLNGWIDWNNNAVMEAGEQVFSDVAVTNGTATRTFSVPVAQDYTNPLYARFRVCNSTGQCNTPEATDVLNGEIEDYLWNFGPLAVTLDSLSARSAQNGTALLILGTTVALGAVGVIALRRRK